MNQDKILKIIKGLNTFSPDDVAIMLGLDEPETKSIIKKYLSDGIIASVSDSEYRYINKTQKRNKGIKLIHNRLDKVLIENRDFEKFIKQYDHEGAFFYCDPPYSYGAGYAVTSTKDFDHERLRDCLKKIQGRFLLSYDDSPIIRELYKDFEMIEVERMNGINNVNRKNKMFKELIIANYPIKENYANSLGQAA